MTGNKISAASAALAILLAAGTTTTMASSVAVSINEITNFGLTFTGGSNTFSGFTFSNDTAATENGGTGGVDLMDAPSSCVGNCNTGGVQWENQFFAHSSLSEFSYGDAEIQNANVTGGQGSASAIGEVNVINGFANASGSNVMTSTFNISGGGSTIGFQFDADPFLNTALTTGGISTAANIFFNITIRDSSSATVFEWSPNGAAGGITGGSENADPFSLNSGIAGNNSYNPGNASFDAATNLLADGLYSINIKMENQANANAVPVPAAAWLFGSGLLGMVAVARRRS